MTQAPGFLVVGGDSLVGGGVVLRSEGAVRGFSPARVGATRSTPSGSCSISKARAVPGARRRRLCLCDRRGDELRPLRERPTRQAHQCRADPACGRVTARAGPVRHVHLHQFGIWRRAAVAGRGHAHAPRIAYAARNREGENVIRRGGPAAVHPDRLNIVRLTKIMNAGVAAASGLGCGVAGGEPVAAVRGSHLRAACRCASWGTRSRRSAKKRISGNLHLSGAGRT